MKNKKKLIKYIVMAAVIIAAVIYFLKNPVSADKLSALLEKNNPKAAAVLLLLFSVKGFVPVILYMALAAACGLLFDLKYAITLKSYRQEEARSAMVIELLMVFLLFEYVMIKLYCFL